MAQCAGIVRVICEGSRETRARWECPHASRGSRARVSLISIGFCFYEFH
jgi:hypothetical protein